MRSTISIPLALGAALLLAAGCAEESTAPTEAERPADAPAPAFAALLTCTVRVGEDGGMDCGPAAGPGAAALAAGLATGSTAGMATATASGAAVTPGGPDPVLIIGGQHHFVRLANATPTVASGVWSAGVTVQNLTLQPMATLDGSTPVTPGLQVFFVDAPNHDVEVLNEDGVDFFTVSEPQKYYQYDPGDLGGDLILTPGETSAPKTWQFALNGASTFEFSVLVSTHMPDESAYSVHLDRVVAGSDHTCGEGSDGKVYCWGYNGEGQLGDGSTVDHPTPTEVAAPAVGVTLSNVTAGYYHTCAEGSDGNAYCWGDNGYGQLGDGTTTERHTPTEVAAPAVGVTLSNMTASEGHTCAEGSDGNVYCWGDNGGGQLGNGTIDNSAIPVEVTAPEVGVTLSNVTAGASHTCAEGSDGNAYCWGENRDGQLGNGSTDDSSIPVEVAAPEVGVTLSNVTAGDSHTCAEGSDGNAYCWGDNFYGQLGDGSTTDHPTPTEVAGGVTLSNITAGDSHTCGEDSNGNAYCWGENVDGQLGDGSTTERHTPAPVAGGVTLSNVTVGDSHTCAEGSDGNAYCWGGNSEGQLGDGTATERHTPVVVAGTQ